MPLSHIARDGIRTATGLNEPADHGLGRSHGGLTAKLRPAVEHGQRPLSLVLAAEQRAPPHPP
ncbi:hypothetical protein ABZ806_26425 [Spirillospora sp. NPDC047418]